MSARRCRLVGGPHDGHEFEWPDDGTSTIVMAVAPEPSLALGGETTQRVSYERRGPRSHRHLFALGPSPFFDYVE